MDKTTHAGRLSVLVSENWNENQVIDALILLAVGSHDGQLAELQRLQNMLARRKMSSFALEYWADIAKILEGITEMKYCEMFQYCVRLLTKKTDNLFNVEAER